MSTMKDRAIDLLNSYYADQRSMVRQETRSEPFPKNTGKIPGKSVRS